MPLTMSSPTPTRQWLVNLNTNDGGKGRANSSLLLLGGFVSPNTTELVHNDGQSNLRFSLKSGRSDHCSIEVGIKINV